MKTKKSIIKLFLILLLGNFALMQIATAKPLKINDARWKGGWNHTGATTTLASSGKTITTVLPEADTINSDYTVHVRMFTNLGDPAQVSVRALSHSQMILCNNFTPNSAKPIIQSSCIAKRYTPNDGMRRLTQPTTVKIK